jgi:hypothetical protein
MVGGYLFLTQFVGGLKEHQDFNKKSSSEREYNMEEEYKVRLNVRKFACNPTHLVGTLDYEQEAQYRGVREQADPFANYGIAIE